MTFWNLLHSEKGSFETASLSVDLAFASSMSFALIDVKFFVNPFVGAFPFAPIRESCESAAARSIRHKHGMPVSDIQIPIL